MVPLIERQRALLEMLKEFVVVQCSTSHLPTKVLGIFRWHPSGRRCGSMPPGSGRHCHDNRSTLRQIKPSDSAKQIDIEQVFEQPFGGALRVVVVLENAGRFGQREDGQAVRGVLGVDRRLQRIGTFRIAVTGDEDGPALLAGSPERRVGSVPWQTEILERT
jgi:hypothetical protein